MKWPRSSNSIIGTRTLLLFPAILLAGNRIGDGGDFMFWAALACIVLVAIFEIPRRANETG